MLKLMYITNDPLVAEIADSNGVDRIFIDMEYIGKEARQGGRDSVMNHHTVEDLVRVKNAVSNASVLCRVNPIHEESADYCSSREEIDEIVEAKADVIMLPYFKTCEEVAEFVDCVGGRAKTSLLVETPEAVSVIDEILKIDGVDEVHIGLNDLSIGYGMKFMFELLVDGTVEKICNKCRDYNKSYGFGGIASIGKGLLPSEYVIREHYRLGSTCAILSRSFCNIKTIENIDEVRKVFGKGLKKIRDFEAECACGDSEYFAESRKIMIEKIKKISDEMK